MIDRKIRVLVVDDSAIVRKILTESLSGESDIEVVGTAPDAIIARSKIELLKPDVLTLDIEMPRLDGVTFLKQLMEWRPMPVIVISSLAANGCAAALRATENGAVEVLAKPAGAYSVGDLRLVLAHKIRSAARARIRVAQPSSNREPIVRPTPACLTGTLPPHCIIAIGASTGGTEAIRAVLEVLPAAMPPILIVQHIPPVFSRALAERLNGLSQLTVREAVDGDQLAPGLALLAPGDFHMILRRVAGHYRVEVKTGPRVCYQRPSVDVLFHSVAELAGRDSIGVLMTGMGSDGAQGLLAMRRAGAHTIGQDEQTCVVYGMPKEAAKAGAVEKVLPLYGIPTGLCHFVNAVQTRRAQPA